MVPLSLSLWDRISAPVLQRCFLPLATNKNGPGRAALVHLNFNVIGATVGIVLFYVVRAVAAPALLGQAASEWGIAVAHSIFNILCTAVLLPMGGLLEKLVLRLVPEGKQPQREAELDERLLATPALALERLPYALPIWQPIRWNAAESLTPSPPITKNRRTHP